MKRVRRQIISLREDGPNMHRDDVEMLVRALGRFRSGEYSAWVRTGSFGWPERPGFSKLYYDRVENPVPYSLGEINIEATRLLAQSDSEPCNGRSRLLKPDQFVLGKSWLADGPPVFEDCYRLRAIDGPEIEAYIDEWFPGEFFMFGDPFQPFECYLFSEYRFSEAEHRATLKEANLGLPPAEIDRLVGLHAEFPTYIRYRWS